jgi:uncharacterized damage-inducible protein DinB
MDDSQLLNEMLGQWGAARSGAIDEIRSITDPDLDYRVAAGARSLGEIAAHLAHSCLLFAGELTRPDGDFTRQPFSAFYVEYSRGVAGASTVDEVVAMLSSTWQTAEATLRAAGPGMLGQTMNGFTGSPASKSSILQFGVCHEFYHRGQIAMCVRACGHVPALTRALAGLG